MALTIKEEAYIKKLVKSKEARIAYDKKVEEKNNAVMQAKTNFNTEVDNIDTTYNSQIQTLQDALDTANEDLEK